MGKPELIERTDHYNTYASFADDNGIYRVVDYKRVNDDTLYLKSTLSNPDVNGYYQTLTLDYYSPAGTEVVSTSVWTLTYDADGNIVESVVS